MSADPRRELARALEEYRAANEANDPDCDYRGQQEKIKALRAQAERADYQYSNNQSNSSLEQRARRKSLAVDRLGKQKNGNKCSRRGTRLCRRYCRYAYTHAS